jgi:hypothetical protein
MKRREASLALSVFVRQMPFISMRACGSGGKFRNVTELGKTRRAVGLFAYRRTNFRSRTFAFLAHRNSSIVTIVT